MTRTMIELKNVSKLFRVNENRETSIKTIMSSFWKMKIKYVERQVLKNVSFEIKEGEFVGIMGRNGVGKSTTLKLIAGIYKATEGQIITHGKVAPLLELGAGFADELSGYENIFLNAAIMGFSRNQIRTKVDQIIEFSELGEWINRPIKRYSSGMLVRLGFSVAVFMNAPILLFDEVLAVGDLGFQKKSLAKIRQMHREGRAIVLVTHSPEEVRQSCSRCIVIDHQGVFFDGPADEGARIYTESFS